MDSESAFIHEMMEKVTSGSDLNFEEAERLVHTTDLNTLSQSSHYKETGINVYPLLPRESVLERAKVAQESGSKSFCLVCAYKSPPEKEFDLICEMISEIKNTLNIDVNASLGSISREQARRLKKIGVKRYNHNKRGGARIVLWGHYRHG